MKQTTSHRLIQAMNLRGYSQSELVSITKLPKSAISMYVNGNREPRQDKLTILAKALDVNEVWLMGYDVPMERIISNGLNNVADKIINNIVDDVFDKEFYKNVSKLNGINKDKLKEYASLLLLMQEKDK